MGRREWIYLTVVVLIALFLWSLGLRSEFIHADESRYALNGVLIRDLLLDRPFGAVQEYVFNYYARYPALSLPAHAPLFPLVESLFYLVFGVRLLSARLCALAFVLLMAISFFLLALKMMRPPAALAACCLFLTSPLAAVLSREVMAEPMALGMIALAFIFILHYAGSGRPRDLLASAVLMVLACYAKQTSLHVVLAVLIWIVLFNRVRARWVRPASLLALLVVFVLLLPLSWLIYLYARGFAEMNLPGIARAVRNLPEGAAFYLGTLWSVQLAKVTVVLCGVGFFLSLRRSEGSSIRIAVAWLMASLIFFGLIQYKSTRFGLPFVAASCLLAGYGMDLILERLRLRQLMLPLLCLLVVFQLAVAVRASTDSITGYREAAALAMKKAGGRPIFFRGYHNGTFIFFVRVMDPQKVAVVLRASKLLSVSPTMPEFGVDELVSSPQEIIDLLEESGVGLVVVEEYALDEGRPQWEEGQVAAYGMLRELLKDSSRFRPVARVPIVNRGALRGSEIAIYQFTDGGAGKARRFEINMPTMGRPIEATIGGQVSTFDRDRETP